MLPSLLLLISEASVARDLLSILWVAMSAPATTAANKPDERCGRSWTCRGLEA